MFFPKKLFLQPQIRWINDQLFDTTGEYSLMVPAGNYKITVCGGGGGGGAKGANCSRDNTEGGAGGAGAPGETSEMRFTFIKPIELQIVVGQGGQSVANGGNGGAARTGGLGAGGAGGGGGRPSYVTANNNLLLFADGGGGGGGGGGSNVTTEQRWTAGSCGGSGGGRYALEVNEGVINIISYPGKIGGASGNLGKGSNGVAGDAVAFPQIFSGGGGGAGDWTGNFVGGTSGAKGGGASGGGGGGYNENSNYAHGGGGGGGAGGTAQAGGGRGGKSSAKGNDAYNPYSTPVSVLNNLGQEVTTGFGIGGQGQTASQTATAGADGWVYVEKLSLPLPALETYESPYVLTEPTTEPRYISMPPGNYYVGLQSTNGGDFIEVNTKLVTTQTWGVYLNVDGDAYIKLESGNSPRILWESSGDSTTATEGFVKIIQLADVTSVQNNGLVTESVTETKDLGNVTQEATVTQNLGGIIK